MPARSGDISGLHVTIANVLQRSLAGLCLLLLATFASATVTVENYGYPIKDRFVATVVGTPEGYEAKLPKEIPTKKRWLNVFPERHLPDLIWYGQEMIYSETLQDHPAPLIFLIAGTGAAYNGGKNVNMARAFYKAGFHVVSLSSPTFPNFVTSASTTGVVGHSEKDAEDLYRVMEMIWKRLDGKIDVTSFNLTGYSLGAFNSAYVAKLDEERKSFNFRKVLLINPPVSLYSSISLLDRMVENIPGGEDNFNEFFDKLVKAFSKIYKEEDDIGGDFLYQAYKAMDLKDEELAALIGVSFRMSSGSLVFTSDVMTDFGYVKPKGLVLDRYADLTVYNQVMSRLGFTDYYHDFFYPFYKADYPDMSRDEFISAISLREIADYLRNSPKITVMHNQNDVILEPGEIEFFNEVFGDRATIYPYGGHCGNMNYTENVAHMVATFTEGAQ
ncbi:MAG: alpha/beta hydrolase [Pseudomonadales bacterium]|nr:alpha/beta hydrolase [Pseudomonadales bacterium]MCP5193558.1 alpha/beta hydrolase [Pseudomonadales bacterium]